MSLISLRRDQKVILIILSLLLFITVFITLLHHHADGQQHGDCAVCRLVQQIVGFFILALISFFGLMLNVQSFFRDTPLKSVQIFLVTGLSGRAPPFFSC
jgi:hypothetical protein